MPSADQIAHGKERYENLSCPTCHVVGNVKLEAKIDAAFLAVIKETARGAPNLRFVQRRIPRDILERYILDPKSVDPQSTMPKQVVTPGEAAAIADWLTYGSLEADGVARRRRCSAIVSDAAIVLSGGPIYWTGPLYPKDRPSAER